MSRINTPASIKDAPAASQPLLDNVQKSLGSVPNMFRLIGNSAVGLEGYLGLDGALAKGKLYPATRERIALAVANINGCDYCNAAHTYLGLNVARLNEDEIEQARQGASSDPKANVAIAFARQVAAQRGDVTAEDVERVGVAGYEEEEIVEIVLHVALNTLTNYVNEVFKTDVDFPLVAPAQRIAA